MPAINTYGSDTATAREIQRLAASGDIRNHATFDVTALDGTIDVTAALNAALAARRSDKLHAHHRPPLILPPGRYRISDTLNAQDVPIIAPEGAMILAENVGAGKHAISWTDSAEEPWAEWSPPCASGLWIVGRNTPDYAGAPTYTAGAHGISCGVVGGRWERMRIENFDRAITFANYAYTQTFDRVRASYGRVGMYWGDHNIAGERVTFIHSNLSNNEEAFYIDSNVVGGASRSGSFFFIDTSMDYNTVRHGRIIGPKTSANDLLTDVVLQNCHLETGNSTTPNTNPRIENAGNLALIGCHLYEAELEGGYASLIDNPAPGRCSVIGTYFGLEGTAPWCTGNGNWRVSGNRQRWGRTVNITSSVADAPA